MSSKPSEIGWLNPTPLDYLIYENWRCYGKSQEPDENVNADDLGTTYLQKDSVNEDNSE